MKHKKQSRISIFSVEKGGQNLQQFAVNESNKVQMEECGVLP